MFLSIVCFVQIPYEMPVMILKQTFKMKLKLFNSSFRSQEMIENDLSHVVAYAPKVTTSLKVMTTPGNAPRILQNSFTVFRVCFFIFE